MSATTKEIPVTFAGIDGPGSVPAWARAFHATRSTLAELCVTSALPGIAVLQSTRPRKVIEQTDQLSKLFESYSDSTHFYSRLILGFKKAEAEEFLNLAPILAKYPGLSSRVELVRQSDDLQDALLEAITKVLASHTEHDPLAEVSSVAKVDRSLRAENGRIDAEKVAAAFGFSMAELGRQIGIKNRQTIAKTPYSEALQPLLRPYERIARLRTVLSEADFKAWLHTPNDLLEDREAPIDYLKAGAREPLASVAENMLTGAST
ncbi:MAG: hypothetical protein GVY36_05650 [Verrucomicrobia bacterium]|jgi:hypothetical protein|nr:hypothetical protein [Verrucomicrobiota bacterium]